MFAHVRRPVTRSARLRPAAIQRLSDPSPPPDLDRSALPAYQPVGGPVPDDGLVIEDGSATARPERPEEASTQTLAVPGHGGGGGVPSPTAVSAVLGAGGRPLSPGTRDSMESFFGHDFASVRVFDDGRAHGLAGSFGARALTVGDKVALGAGVSASSAHECVLAHELTHVVQQSAGLDRSTVERGIGEAGDAYEREAERNAEQYLRGGRNIGPAGRRIERRGGTTTVGHGPLQLYSGAKAAAYAQKWAMSTNPAYPRYSNDCTNFVSQAVLEGGWTMTSGGCWSRKDNDVWWYGSKRCWYPRVRSSYTWAGAHNFSRFVGTSGRGTAARHVADLDLGDILHMAFSGTHINHSMVLTDKKNGDLFFSYHTSDHLDEPFYAPGGILDRYPTANYYGWKL